MISSESATAGPPEIDAEEWRLRVELAAIYRLAARMGWSELIYNHITVRLPGSEQHFLINQFGHLYSEVTASNLVKVARGGDVVSPPDAAISRSGFIIHGAIHEARDDVLCVMHCHTREGTAVSAQRDGLLPLSIESMLLSGRIAYHDFEGIVSDPDERSRIVADLGDKDVLLFRNHGLLTCGRTVAEAFYLMYMLQRSCEIQVAALVGNRDLLLPSPTIEQKVMAESRQAGTNLGQYELVLSALMRVLDREEPGYRE